MPLDAISEKRLGRPCYPIGELYTYNNTGLLFLLLQPDSEVAEAGQCLEVFFEGKLKEIYPDKHFPLMQQEDSDSEEVESEHNQMPPKGFQWPSYGQDCIQPKRRRRHAVRMQKQKHLVAKWPHC